MEGKRRIEMIVVSLIVMVCLIGRFEAKERGTDCRCQSSEEFGENMREWLSEAKFQATLDTATPKLKVHHVNNVDLAVLAFPVEGCECPPIYSQVLLSRDFPLGLKGDLNTSTLTGLGSDWGC